MLCWLGRHLPVEAGTMFLGHRPTLCGRCGTRLTGWDQDDIRPPKLTQPGNPAKHALAPAVVATVVVPIVRYEYPQQPADLELAGILADLDEQQKGRRVH